MITELDGLIWAESEVIPNTAHIGPIYQGGSPSEGRLSAAAVDKAPRARLIATYRLIAAKSSLSRP